MLLRLHLLDFRLTCLLQGHLYLLPQVEEDKAQLLLMMAILAVVELVLQPKQQQLPAQLLLELLTVILAVKYLLHRNKKLLVLWKNSKVILTKLLNLTKCLNHLHRMPNLVLAHLLCNKANKRQINKMRLLPPMKQKLENWLIHTVLKLKRLPSKVNRCCKWVNKVDLPLPSNRN